MAELTSQEEWRGTLRISKIQFLWLCIPLAQDLPHPLQISLKNGLGQSDWRGSGRLVLLQERENYCRCTEESERLGFLALSRADFFEEDHNLADAKMANKRNTPRNADAGMLEKSMFPQQIFHSKEGSVCGMDSNKEGTKQWLDFFLQAQFFKDE